MLHWVVFRTHFAASRLCVSQTFRELAGRFCAPLTTMQIRHFSFLPISRIGFFALMVLTISLFANSAQAANRELGALPKAEQPLPASVRQLVVAIAPTWNSMHGKLQIFERDADGKWMAVSGAVSVLFGKHGLAWGRGLRGFSGSNESGLHKREHDWRAPAGVFKIGKIYTYDAQLPVGADYPFHTVGAWDAWVDDVHSPLYNQFVTVDPKNPPAWFAKEKMRHGDFAYRWLVEIRANSDPAIPGDGSAIFFHIRRGPNRPSAGCTTMPESALVDLIRHLRADKNPCYALLPWSEYLAKWRAWGLPDLQAVSALAPSR